MTFLSYAEPRGRAERDAPFFKMAHEGLLPWAMSAHAAPGLDDWRRVTARGVLLRCHNPDGDLLGCGHFTPLRGLVWEFDFTAFRAGFHLAPAMARGAFARMFERHGAGAIVGITPARFRHAWQLAEACGFTRAARLPGACWLARKQRFEDGVMLVCTPETLRALQTTGAVQEGE